MEYSPTIINVTRQQLLSELRTQVSSKRFDHILGVEQTALDLAKHYKADPQKVSIAALLHDYAKEMPIAILVEKALEYWDHPLFKEADSTILHGFAAATIARENFGITDEDILSAIAYHTMGAKNMSLIAKVLYIADYIEPGRSFPQVEEARRIAYQNLDQAALYKMKQTLHYLISQEYYIFPDALDVYNQWIKS